MVMSRVNQGAAMPLAHAAQIRSVPGVTAVAPFNVLIGTYQRPNNPMLIIGTDFDAMLKISADLIVAPDQAAAMRRTRNGVIVGVTIASSMAGRSGDRVPLHGFAAKTDGSTDWAFDIVGTYTLQQPDWATRCFRQLRLHQRGAHDRQEPGIDLLRWDQRPGEVGHDFPDDR